MTSYKFVMYRKPVVRYIHTHYLVPLKNGFLQSNDVKKTVSIRHEE